LLDVFIYIALAPFAHKSRLKEPEDAPTLIVEASGLNRTLVPFNLINPVPALITPLTSSAYEGLIFPTPTLPFCNTVSPDDPATLNPPANVEVAVEEVAM
jgi:hypothetical protein